MRSDRLLESIGYRFSTEVYAISRTRCTNQHEQDPHPVQVGLYFRLARVTTCFDSTTYWIFSLGDDHVDFPQRLSQIEWSIRNCPGSTRSPCADHEIRSGNFLPLCSANFDSRIHWYHHITATSPFNGHLTLWNRTVRTFQGAMFATTRLVMYSSWHRNPQPPTPVSLVFRKMHSIARHRCIQDGHFYDVRRPSVQACHAMS